MRGPESIYKGVGKPILHKNINHRSNWLIFFFPVKIEIWPDLVEEVSTGNTPEISTSRAPKSANTAYFQPKIRNFHHKICCRQKFLAGPKFYFLKNMASQLHFALRIKCITQKLANLVFIKVGGFWENSIIFSNLKIPKSKWNFLKIRQLW